MSVILTDPNQLPDSIKNNLQCDPKDLQDQQFVLKDLLQGDMAAFKRIKNVDIKQLQLALDYIKKTAQGSPEEISSLLSESWRILYRAKPPTPEEFITYDYLGPTADYTYDYIKQEFCKFMDPEKNYRHLVLYPHIGWGKMSYSEEKVMTPEGYRKAKDMKVGDTVATPNQGTAKVMAVRNYPDEPIYKVTFGDGRTALVGGPHYWKAARNYDNSYWDKEQKKYVLYPKTEPKRPSWKIITTEEILKDMEAHPGKNRGWFIPLTQPVPHEEREHVIPPYTMGALLGDGSLHKKVSIGNDDKEIIDRVIKEMTPSGFEPCCYDRTELKEQKKSSVKYYLYFKKNAEIKEELRGLGIQDTYSDTKFIPDEYKYDSIENRIALLQGLMDTDGTVVCKETYPRASYCTLSKQLKDDFVELCSGLGAARCVVTQGKDKVYTITVTFPDNSFPIFGLERKQKWIDAEYAKDKSGHKQQRKPRILHIHSIEKTGLKGGTCIETDDDERLYLTTNYVVTHNSYLSTITILYIITCLSLLKDPYKMFGLNPATKICCCLCSYSLKKSSELLLEPFNNMLDASPYFEKITRKDAMIAKKEEFSRNNEDVTKLYYTTATATSAFEFDSGITVKLVSTPANLLGLTIAAIVFSELSFFTDAGKSSEYIMRFYNDGRQRVYSRFKGHYYSRSILDSSPNNLDNAIDDWIVHQAGKSKENYIVEGSIWKWHPKDYEAEFRKKELFPVFVGTKGQPPRILTGPDDDIYKDPNVDKTKIIDVPNSLKGMFEDSLVKMIKDYAGIPSGSADTLISDYSSLEAMFDNPLKNVYKGIHASSELEPRHLIWDQVKDIFFKNVAGRWQYYYKPWIPRYISVDQSYATDVTGIAMVHKERLKEDGSDIFIVDFTIPIVPAKGQKVNLEAIRCFISELRNEGNLNIAGVSFDQFQSQTTIQNLEREKFNVSQLSVDTTNGPYLNFLSYMNRKRVACGKNIFLKNNLKSLHMVQPKDGKKEGRRKIDHDSSKPQILEGEEEWEKSLIGYYGKDVSDAVAAAVALCDTNYPLAQDNWDPSELVVNEDKDSEREKAKERMKAMMKNMF